MLSLRNLLEDIAIWGWAEAPSRRLVFAADIPKLDRALPRALTPDVDARLMAAVADLPDPFARTGLQVLRGTGLRVGELLDLELGAVVDYGPAGTWLRVPLGKIATERTVPLDEQHFAGRPAASRWATRLGEQSPATGRPGDASRSQLGADFCLGGRCVRMVGLGDLRPALSFLHCGLALSAAVVTLAVAPARAVIAVARVFSAQAENAAHAPSSAASSSAAMAGGFRSVIEPVSCARSCRAFTTG